MGIQPPDPLIPIGDAHVLDYDDVHEAFTGTAGPLYLFVRGQAWDHTARAASKISQATYDILRVAEAPNGENLFVSGGLTYGLFDADGYASAEPA